jgi:hypothetical protein
LSENLGFERYKFPLVQEAVREQSVSRYQAIFLYLWSSVGEAPVKPEPDEGHNCMRKTYL